MTQAPCAFLPDFERLARCPVCEAPTVTWLARLRLYLGAKERCRACMAGWKFTWGKWLYHLPIFGMFVLVTGIYALIGVALDGLVVIGAVLIAAAIVPLFLPIEARVGDRLTDHAIRRVSDRLTDHAIRRVEQSDDAAHPEGGEE